MKIEDEVRRELRHRASLVREDRDRSAELIQRRLAFPRRQYVVRAATIAFAAALSIAALSWSYVAFTHGTQRTGANPSAASRSVQPSPLVRVNPVMSHVVDVGGYPRAIVEGGGSVWAVIDSATSGPYELARIDPTTGSIVDHLMLPSSLGILDITYGGGSVWALASGASGPAVLEIDPTDTSLSQTYPLPTGSGPRFSPWSIEYGADSLWVSGSTGNDDPPAGAVLRIDRATGTIVVRISTVGEARDLVFADGSLWVYGHSLYTPKVGWSASTLHQIDPSTNGVVATYLDQTGVLGDGSDMPDNVAATGGYAWAADVNGNAVRIDEATGSLTNIVVPGGFQWPFIGPDGGVWFWDSFGGTLERLDPATQQVDTVFSPGGSGAVDVTVDDSGTIWIADYRDTVRAIKLG